MWNDPEPPQETNYFLIRSDKLTEDLLTQYWIIHYLEKADLLDSFKASSDEYVSFVTQFLKRLTPSAGSTYINPTYVACPTLYQRLRSGNEYLNLDVNELFLQILEYMELDEGQSAYYFRNSKIGDLNQTPSRMFPLLCEEYENYPIATNYFCLQLLADYDLTEEIVDRILSIGRNMKGAASGE